MSTPTLTPAERADRLRALHHAGEPLVLPNAWDAASARAFAGLGFPALATTSAGVAQALGFEDGERAPADEMLSAAARIAAAVEVPVSFDMEAGYGLPAAELAERLLAAGAAGLNLEDSDHARGGLVEAEAQASRIAAVKGAGRSAGADLVLNARVDVYVRQVGEPEGRLDEALRRAHLYFEAGADCVYPLLLQEEGELGAFVARAGGPVNVLLRPGAPPLARLAELGVARVTFASGLLRVALKAATANLEELGRLPAG
ncbi:MAG: isocitrate lyase/phosphoenolpyruvate mutase family protein [Candidatus Dormibacteraeota bacterium]|nr:isocitrate lyase/phosphoenolpyruvate mutase family protein [Candidatus Dormibacteraeota bacterium]